MPEKTPHELLRESLDRNAKQLATLPDWVRAAISTESIFKVTPRVSTRADDGRDASDGERQPV
jgi:hypothetical protein